jgi:purine-binding chemotaxis protein CheW
MTDTTSHISDRADALRRAFVRSFVEVQHFDAAATADFISLRVGGDAYLARLPEIAGLYVDRKVTGVPSRIPELRGVAGFRGAILPVYDLAALLGYPLAASPRWMLIAAAAPVALAFELYEGHARFAREMVSDGDAAVASRHVRQVVRSAGAVRALVDLASIAAAIRARIPAASPKQEH